MRHNLSSIYGKHHFRVLFSEARASKTGRKIEAKPDIVTKPTIEHSPKTHSRDLLDRFDLIIPDVSTPELVVGPVEAALVRVAKALGADLCQAACWVSQISLRENHAQRTLHGRWRVLLRCYPSTLYPSHRRLYACL